MNGRIPYNRTASSNKSRILGSIPLWSCITALASVLPIAKALHKEVSLSQALVTDTATVGVLRGTPNIVDNDWVWFSWLFQNRVHDMVENQRLPIEFGKRHQSAIGHPCHISPTHEPDVISWNNSEHVVAGFALSYLSGFPIYSARWFLHTSQF